MGTLAEKTLVRPGVIEDRRPRFRSARTARFTESVIREMTRLCNLHNGINLSQGFPDFSAPEEMKEAACRAIQDNINQYAITWGAKNLRNAIAEKTARFNGFQIDPEKNVTVCCGSTEAMISSIQATIDPGEEIIVFEPYYENYGPDAILSGAVPKFTLGTCRAPSSVLKYASLRVNPLMPATRLFGKVAMKVL